MTQRPFFTLYWFSIPKPNYFGHFAHRTTESWHWRMSATDAHNLYWMRECYVIPTIQTMLRVMSHGALILTFRAKYWNEKKKRSEKFFCVIKWVFASFPFNCVIFVCVRSFQEHRFNIINTLETFFSVPFAETTTKLLSEATKANENQVDLIKTTTSSVSAHLSVVHSNGFMPYRVRPKKVEFI